MAFAGVLAAGLTGLLCAIFLGYFLLSTRSPELLAVLTALTGALMSGLGFLGLRDEQTRLRQASHWVAGSALLKAVMVCLLVVGVGSWGVYGRGPLQETLFGRQGCRSACVYCYTLEDFKVPKETTTGAADTNVDWIAGMRAALIEKLSVVQQRNVIPTLKVFCSECNALTEAMKQRLDYSIQGEIQQADRPMIMLRLFGKDGVYEPLEIVAAAAAGQSVADIEALRNELVFNLLWRFGIPLDEQLMATIRRTPTDNFEAMELNSEGVKLVTQGQMVEAETKFRAALDLDSSYSVAYANWGWALSITTTTSAATNRVEIGRPRVCVTY